MQLVNRRRNDNKRTRSLAAIEIRPGDFKTTDRQLALVLPPNALVTSVTSVCEAAHDAGQLSIQAIKPDGTVDVNFDLIQTQSTFGVSIPLEPAFLTGSGANVYITPLNVMTVGRVIVLIEYDEYSLSTGELTAVEDLNNPPPASTLAVGVL